MAFDIYGNNLPRGHCEVHPNVAEEYPCFVCIGDKRKKAIDRERKTENPSTMCPGAGCTDQGCPAHYANDCLPTPEVAKLVEALEEIAHPVRFMRERLEEGEQLNGMMAVQLANDAEYLKGIARAALAAHHKQGGDV